MTRFQVTGKMIEVADIRKAYGAIQAVDGVSMSIKPGEAFGLLGPNGAGKTTTIQIILGVLRPDSGTVTVDGLDPREPSTRCLVGVAPQGLSIYEELTARENLVFFGKLYGLTGAQLKQRVAWCLEFSQLEDRRNSRTKTYSGGMKRRLNLACALVHDPKVLLLDEPTVGVDPQSRNHIFESIDQLKQEGRTIIYTTHYMEEAQRLCDRVAIIDHGKILAMGAVGELIVQYGGRSVITAELQRAPDNREDLPGQIEGTSLRFESTQPLEEVSRLASTGFEFRALQISSPDLETVFLTLTGRSLRE